MVSASNRATQVRQRLVGCNPPVPRLSPRNRGKGASNDLSMGREAIVRAIDAVYPGSSAVSPTPLALRAPAKMQRSVPRIASRTTPFRDPIRAGESTRSEPTR